MLFACRECLVIYIYIYSTILYVEYTRFFAQKPKSHKHTRRASVILRIAISLWAIRICVIARAYTDHGVHCFSIPRRRAARSCQRNEAAKGQGRRDFSNAPLPSRPCPVEFFFSSQKHKSCIYTCAFNGGFPNFSTGGVSSVFLFLPSSRAQNPRPRT